MFEKILVATDGSEHGMRAAKVALELGERSSGTVSVIYVADTNQTSYLPDDVLLFSIRELLLKEGKEAVKQVEMMAKDAGVKFESIIVEGNPGSEVVDFAEKAGMNIIVIGAIDRTGLNKFLLGSVAEKVVRHSKIPVLVVPLID